MKDGCCSDSLFPSMSDSINLRAPRRTLQPGSGQDLPRRKLGTGESHCEACNDIPELFQGLGRSVVD